MAFWPGDPGPAFNAEPCPPPHPHPRARNSANRRTISPTPLRARVSLPHQPDIFTWALSGQHCLTIFLPSGLAVSSYCALRIPTRLVFAFGIRHEPFAKRHRNGQSQMQSRDYTTTYIGQDFIGMKVTSGQVRFDAISTS